MVSGRPLPDAPETSNLCAIRLDEAVPGIDLIIARVCDGDDFRSRLDVRSGACSPSCVP